MPILYSCSFFAVVIVLSPEKFLLGKKSYRLRSSLGP